MINIAVCDDNELYVSELENLIKKYFEEKNIDFRVDLYTNSDELYNSRDFYDIYFLDVEMPEINGIEIAKKVLKNYENAIIFFITNYEHYLDEAFDVNAFRYLYKPIDVNRLFRGIDLAIQRIEKKNSYILVHIADKIIQLSTDDIIYITIENRHCRIVTTDGYKIVDDQIKKIFEQLPDSHFTFSHKSYIVNLSYVKNYDNTKVDLQYGDNTYSVYVSRRMLPEFRKKMLLYARGAI